MDQVNARRHARMLSEVTGTIHVATTETALRGHWPAAEEVWVIIPVGAYPLARAIRTVYEAITEIDRYPRPT